MKNDEKVLRIKYIRALEKFANSATSALKRDDFDLSLFQERMKKNAQIFKKIQVVFLDSTYTKALENFVNDCLDNTLDRRKLLNKVNTLHKLKKQQSYKKEKYKNNFKDEI
ncbi:hypothetical protein CINS5915_00815 [Campylobacter insulaenigrae]|uniref:Uncharacterized protein n=1 Tax=Campylobacter insulaenigrae TaxID=260714 RepID=A0ABY3G2D5_9BACT|nr:hypothetical protein [Campylobacter insulaenigrae]MCR6570086.1 hypothetical protein [Campylobacter insulaenigrae]MCR6571871.1 hypothetical protein [Campylobacter insulaenigrae]MCR6573129.1 hypothetical protein [Campylobacter insulaenigrae]MCR6574916.1 hypothetical protein [Campylobacter insulaenigrae]MCR6576402.1 hypothetical protein [Campylobacter insulaenigrae]